MSNNGVGWGGSVVTLVTAGASLITPQLIVTIILGVLGIISTIVSLAYTLHKWYKEAKKDGKITEDELKQGIDLAVGGAVEIADKINDVVEDSKDGNSHK